jgi:disease resistance protein RPM1
MGSLEFLQTLDVRGNVFVDEEVETSIGLLTKLLCLRFRSMFSIVADGIGKLTSLEELDIDYAGEEEEARRRFVKELCGLRELRVLRLHIPYSSMGARQVVLEGDMVLQLLRSNFQKLEILLLKTNLTPVSADTAAWQAEGFLLPRRLRQLSIRWITFSRFPSVWINPSRLPHLSLLSLRVHAMNEEDLRILGGLPQLRFLDLDVDSTAYQVVCSNTRTHDDGCCSFRNLERCRLRCKGVRFLTPSQGDSGRVSFCMCGMWKLLCSWAVKKGRTPWTIIELQRSPRP